MAKDRRNISISKEANQILDQEHVNASGLIDDLVRAYGAYGSVEGAVEFSAEKRAENREKRLRDAVETLSTIDAEKLDRFNDGVLNQASRLEIPPEDLVGIVEHYRENDELPEEVLDA